MGRLNEDGSVADGSETILMRVNASGYGGDPVSLFAAYKPASDLLLVVDERRYMAGPLDGYVLFTTTDRDESYDILFDREMLRDAIAAYFDMKSTRRVEIAAKVSKHDPETRIQQKGVDERGIKYELDAPTNGQIAVLMAAHLTAQQRGAVKAIEMMDDFMAFTI